MLRAVVSKLTNKLYRVPVFRKAFFSSTRYWESRYSHNGNSGPGSYHRLAEFKANILNSFVEANGIQSVIEFGCGDGNQLKLALYPKYTGYDVSSKAVQICRELFSDDPTKSFHLVSEYKGNTADLSLSLDVIYHLVEDDVYSLYMENLFRSSTKWVVIYSSDSEDNPADSIHVRHRKFTEWVKNHQPGCRLHQHIPNQYPALNRFDTQGSFADFFIYEKTD